jgi:hypothetical protein
MVIDVVEVECNHEPVTQILYYYRVEKFVHPYFDQKGFNVIELFGNDATRENFAPACMLPIVDFITGGGHGYDDYFLGHMNQELWRVGNYDPKEPKGKIIHLMSCLTANMLGHNLIDNGSLAYFGYKVSFSFPQYQDGTDPLNDPRIEPFFECDSAIDKFIADCLPANEVYKKTMELYEEKLQELSAIPDSGLAPAFLRYNFENLCHYGNPDIALPCIDDVIVIQIGKAISGKLSGTGSIKEYVIKGVESDKNLIINLNGSAGQDFDLYVKFGSKATISDWDYRGYTGTANEELTIKPTEQGDYFVTVNSYRGAGLFSLKADYQRPDGDGELLIDETISDTLNEGESRSYIIKGVDEDKNLVALLDGPAGQDFDLYIKYNSVPTLKDWDDRGYSGTSREKVEIYPTIKNGNYYVMVHSHRGSGNYKLKATL